MSETMMNEILKRLDLIGAKLAEGGAFLWEAAVREQLIKGVFFLVIGVFLATVAIRCSVAAHRRFTKNTYDDTGLAASVVAVFASLFGTMSFYGAASHLLNPHFNALLELARMLGR